MRNLNVALDVIGNRKLIDKHRMFCKFQGYNCLKIIEIKPEKPRDFENHGNFFWESGCNKKFPLQINSFFPILSGAVFLLLQVGHARLLWVVKSSSKWHIKEYYRAIRMHSRLSITGAPTPPKIRSNYENQNVYNL